MAKSKKEDPVKEFARKVSKAMKDLSSSHVYFIMQQAYGGELDWGEVAEILDEIQELTKEKP